MIETLFGKFFQIFSPFCPEFLLQKGILSCKIRQNPSISNRTRAFLYKMPRKKFQTKRPPCQQHSSL